MEFRCAVVTLFCLALVGAGHAHESIADESYWQAVWPNTPIPPTLMELLKPGTEDANMNNLPMKIDDTQYPKNFFFEHELYPGKTMNLQFSKIPYAQPYGVWFYLRIHKDIEKEGYTYEEVCILSPAGHGEERYCAKSLATLIGFSVSKLGKNIQPLSSSFLDKQNQYTIEGVQNLGDKAVMCHRLNFQNVVFYCHEIHQTTAYQVSMVAADGTNTQALAVCHHDTSAMNPDILYELLKVKPGTATACHFLGNKAVMWVPNLPTHNAYTSTMEN
ncbi:unknown seed protein USP-like [Arachis stenosperma]|uniref:unknown seed protein USP-like n=1 Tax=Arachis stenosperma TaxID=217475 RepID=UPI0025AD8E8F|nr:unknown seed protein USP-like [Arachis stenosperma]